MRVQEHARKAELGELLIEIRIAVFLIARNRVPGVRGVHTDLMRAPREQAHLHERCAFPKELQGAKIRKSRLARRVHLHRALAAYSSIRAQRDINAAAPVLPMALEQCEIALFKLAFAEQRQTVCLQPARAGFARGRTQQPDRLAYGGEGFVQLASFPMRHRHPDAPCHRHPRHRRGGLAATGDDPVDPRCDLGVLEGAPGRFPDRALEHRRRDPGHDRRDRVAGVGPGKGGDVPVLHGRGCPFIAEHRPFVHRLEQVVLGPEGEVDGLHRDAGPLRDGFHRGAAIARFAEEGVCRCDDPRPGRVRPRLAR